MDFPKVILGLTPDSKKQGHATFRKLHEILTAGLSFDRHFSVLRSLFDASYSDNREIDLQRILDAVNSRRFRDALRSFYTSTQIIEDLEVIKEAIFLVATNKLTVKLLRSAVTMWKTDNIWRYRHYEAMREEYRYDTEIRPSESEISYSEGISLVGDHLSTVFRALSRFLPTELLRVWRARYLPSDRDYITIVEFLYLLANSVDRKQALEAVSLTPKVDKTEGKFGVFPLAEVTFDRCSPDRCAQTIANAAIKSFQVPFLLESDGSVRTKRRFLRDKTVRKSDGNFDPDLCEVLKTPKLRREIKATLRKQLERVSLSKGSRSPRATDFLSLKESPQTPLLSLIRRSDKFQTQYDQTAKRLKNLLFPLRKPQHNRSVTACDISA